LKLVFAFSFTLLLLFQNNSFTGKVVAIKDGDTIVVLSGTESIKIRLHEIDCPELGQDFGRKAKEFTSAICFGKEVVVVRKGKDYFGRTVADIILPDKRILNRTLVENGMAWQFKKYSKDKGLSDLEEKARKAKIGLWSLPKPLPPWEFRKLKKKKQ
jgi:micrococcal nuclease